MRLNALSVGVEAPTMCFSGVIHSIFQHACNVSLESDTLLTLVSSEKGNLSQGIRLGTPPTFTFLNQVRLGQPFACRGGILRISESELSIDLRTARLWHIDLKRLRVDLYQRDTAQAWEVAWLELEKHRRGNGIFPMIVAIPVPRQSPLTSPTGMALDERVVQTVSDLLAATDTFQLDDAINAIKPLIGLGLGLTPSGDDFIVGFLAGLWSTVGGDSSRLRFMSSLGAWLSQAATGTNTISRTYIKSAVNGNVSEPIAILAQRLGEAESLDSVREATRTALQVGNTSGTDGVLGLLLGCTVWAAPSITSFSRTQLLPELFYHHAPSDRS